MQDPHSYGSGDSDAPTLIDLSESLTPETDPCVGHDDLLTGHLTGSSPETSEQALQSYTKLLLAGRKKVSSLTLTTYVP